MYIRYATIDEEQKPLQIEVNLDFDPQEEETVWMLWTFVPLTHPDPSLGCADQEWQRLERTGEMIAEKLELSHGAQFAGIRVQDGWAECYFYAAWAKGAEKVVRNVFREHGYDRLEYGSNRDTHHDFYRDTLYPDDYELQQARSREIIEELEEAGDDLFALRPVEHYLFFQTESARQRAAAALAERGQVQSQMREEGSYPHGLMLELTHACTLEAVEAVTRPLIDMAHHEHGLYLGWNTAMAQ
jgi:regulator of RNase E activity RraB